MNAALNIRLTCWVLLVGHLSWGQTAAIQGRVTSDGEPVAFASVFLRGTAWGSLTDENGYYAISAVPEGTYVVETNAVGFVPVSVTVSLQSDQRLPQDFSIQRDVLHLSDVVITGARSQVERYNSPVVVHAIQASTMEAAQALNPAEILNYAPGLRVENKCQNCGFTQLRMNGLDGAYSQILINSRPVFSALAGVYGLEMMPANMVDRIEVVRGGGSVMFGGNAIAGTVNIITKDPIQNTFEIGLNQSLVSGEVSDRAVNFNGSIVSDDFNRGITFFGFNRNRDQWDANGDGFSEMVRLKNNTFGFDGFYRFTGRDKLKFGAYYMHEFRRGGNKFDLFPHQTDVTEQTDHDILNVNASFEHRSKDDRHTVSVYGSLQHVDRESYYGTGGRVIAPGDSLTAADVIAINAYGVAGDLSTVAGIQYRWLVNDRVALTAGSEHIYNDVLDQMPGYGRAIDQHVGAWGTFAEMELKPTEKWTFLLGGRYDLLDITGRYDLEDAAFENNRLLGVFVPRVSAKYELRDNLKLRASYAQGYRGPQAFDEELHIETVGGAARFIRLGPDLAVERSNSALLSLNHDQYVGKHQMTFLIEGFYTRLSNPFIFSDQEELPSGVSIISKRNGDGATVAGMNAEANVAFGSALVLQSGLTIQQATYDVAEELWTPDEPSEDLPPTTTKRLLRTPDAYGYFSLVYDPANTFSLAYSGVITGSMNVPHVIDSETERTIIETTPAFFEQNFKVSYAFRFDQRYRLEVFGGIQNLFNSYQGDLDEGPNRDSTYVYGPLRPRTFFAGIKWGVE